MPTFETNAFLNQLTTETRDLLRTVQQEFVGLTPAELNRQPSPERWSIAQCLEHLNSYGHYYLPELEKAVRRGKEKQLSPSPAFRSGWLGNYFTNAMRPKADGSIGLKTKAFKSHTPDSQLDAGAVLRIFREQQYALLNLLEEARQVNMQQLRVPISISRLIRLSVGDTFRFLIAHEQRHILQAQRVAKELFLGPKTSVEL